MYEIKSSTSINNPGEQSNIPKVQTTPPVQKMIDATRDDPPYNNNSYPGFDQNNQYTVNHFYVHNSSKMNLSSISFCKALLYFHSKDNYKLVG